MEIPKIVGTVLNEEKRDSVYQQFTLESYKILEEDQLISIFTQIFRTLVTNKEQQIRTNKLAKLLLQTPESHNNDIKRLKREAITDYLSEYNNQANLANQSLIKAENVCSVGKTNSLKLTKIETAFITAIEKEYIQKFNNL